MCPGVTWVYIKLARDKILQMMETRGQMPNIRILDTEEYRAHLEQKLYEQVREYHADKNMAELADILEAVFALNDDRGYSREELLEVYQRKHDARGGFRDRVLLISKA